MPINLAGYTITILTTPAVDNYVVESRGRRYYVYANGGVEPALARNVGPEIVEPNGHVIRILRHFVRMRGVPVVRVVKPEPGTVEAYIANNYGRGNNVQEALRMTLMSQSLPQWQCQRFVGVVRNPGEIETYSYEISGVPLLVPEGDGRWSAAFIDPIYDIIKTDPVIRRTEPHNVADDALTDLIEQLSTSTVPPLWIEQE